jgi:hypothetical protein
MKYVLLTLWVLTPLFAHAATEPLFDDYFANTLTRADDAFRASAPVNDAQSPVVFKQFFLGLAPSVTFGINDVLGVQVTPEVTFIWEKTDRD